MATDIAEVIGGAVALQLLFGFPLLIGVLITTFDVLLLFATDKVRLSQNRSNCFLFNCSHLFVLLMKWH